MAVQRKSKVVIICTLVIVLVVLVVYGISKRDNESTSIGIGTKGTTGTTTVVSGKSYESPIDSGGTAVTFPEMRVQIPWANATNGPLVYQVIKPAPGAATGGVAVFVTSRSLAEKAPPGCDPWFGSLSVVPRDVIYNPTDTLYDLRSSVVKDFNDGTVLTFYGGQFNCLIDSPRALTDELGIEGNAFRNALQQAHR